VCAEHARAVALVFAHGTGVIQQRTQRAHADGQVRTQHVLAEVVEEDAAHGRLQEGNAALVAWCVPGVLVVQRELHERAGQRRHHDFEVASNRRIDPATDEGGRVFQRPDELVHQSHDFDRDGRGLATLGQQEDGDLVVS
jgi:hypothetical protein